MGEMNAGAFGLALASLLYMGCFAQLLRAGGQGERPGVPLLLWSAWALHLAGLMLLLLAERPPRFGFAQALCGTLWVSFAVLLVQARQLDVRSLMRVLMPVAAAVCLLCLVFPGQLLPASAARPEFMAHLFLGTAAYGVLLIALLHALLMVSAQRALQSRDDGQPATGPLRVIGELPPLLTLERLLFGIIGLGFALLTLTLLMGLLFSGEVFGRALRLDHKTLFTSLAWLVFAVLLIGRRLRGWRGRTALRFTLIGFGLLLLGYVGSRFVLEVLLGR